jgi:hypothetical protein
VTSIVTQATVSALQSLPFDFLSRTIGLVIVAHLLVLLLQRELLRAIIGPRASDWVRSFDPVLAPLLITFVIIVSARLADLVT